MRILFVIFLAEEPRGLVSLLNEHNVTSAGRNVLSCVRKRSFLMSAGESTTQQQATETRHFNSANLAQWRCLTCCSCFDQNI